VTRSASRPTCSATLRNRNRSNLGDRGEARSQAEESPSRCRRPVDRCRHLEHRGGTLPAEGEEMLDALDDGLDAGVQSRRSTRRPSGRPPVLSGRRHRRSVRDVVMFTRDDFRGRRGGTGPCRHRPQIFGHLVSGCPPGSELVFRGIAMVAVKSRPAVASTWRNSCRAGDHETHDEDGEQRDQTENVRTERDQRAARPRT